MGASLVSPGTQVVVTNKMSMLSCSHSTLTLTILSLISLRLSAAGVVLELGLVAVNWRLVVNPIIRRVMVAGRMLIMKDTRSSMTKMGCTHSQGLRGTDAHYLSWKSINSSYNEVNEPSSNLSGSSRRQIETAPVRLHCLTVTDFPNNLF